MHVARPLDELAQDAEGLGHVAKPVFGWSPQWFKPKDSPKRSRFVDVYGLSLAPDGTVSGTPKIAGVHHILVHCSTGPGTPADVRAYRLDVRAP